MEPVFRFDLHKRLKDSSHIILELGSGAKKNTERICIDKLNLPHIDIVADLEEGLPFFPDNSVDAIYSKSFLEHVNNLSTLMQDIWRVLKPTGKNVLFVPHFSNPYYYSDYTHKRFFGLYSFEYFSSNQNRFKRKVPSFYHDYGFITEDIKLVFTSPWKGRKLLKRTFQKFVNSHRWLMEFYEENLCYIIPCYGIEVTMRSDKK